MSVARETGAAVGLLDLAPMTTRQYVLLGAALLLAALDGYDALSMAFVAPALARDWSLDKGMVGLLLSSGLIGMAIGALGLAPAADSLGRRRIILGSLLLLTVGALLSGFSHSVVTLTASRVLTGIGIGAMIAMTTLLSSEFANARVRPIAVAGVATIGFPLGGVAGGLLASALLRSVGWHWVFFVGAAAGALLFAVLLPLLPESPAFITARRPSDALAKLNRSLAALGHGPMDAVPASAPTSRRSYALLFSPALAGTTIRLIVINLLVAMPAYYLLNWLPQLVTDAGFPPSTGSLASALSGVLGLVGGTALGALATRSAPARLAALAMGGMTLGLVAIGLVPPLLPALIAASAIFGFSVSGTTGVFYGILAASFPSAARASGVGAVMGIGRIASAVAPAIAGFMFKSGMTRASVSLVFAIGPVVAAVLILSFAARVRMAGEANPIRT